MSLVTDLSGLLRQQADVLPDKLFLRFPDGDWTYREFHDAVTIRARGLVDELGDISKPSDGAEAFPPVLPALLPNCREAVELWFATHRIGWIWAPINTEFRGLGLAHAINLTRSPFLVVDKLLLPQVLDVAEDLEHVTTLLVRCSAGREWSPPRGFRSLRLKDIASHEGELPARPKGPERTVLLIYTSGTTGPSKACRLSAYYVVRQGGLMSEWLGILESDVLFCPFPLFHWDATIGTIVPALLEGATAVIAERFSVSRFWPDVRRYGVTVFDFMGATLGFLHKQEPREDDADTTARLGWGVPMPAFKADFEHRFGLELVEGYGSTEGGVMAFQKSGKEYPAGSCGEELPEFEIRIADHAGRRLPTGSVGEIVVRTRRAEERLLLMSGYFGMPDADAEAFRDGWFHTGDLGRLDDEGNLYFEGRKKDAIRRRGENISAFEVEQAVEEHPDVLEAAAYGVPSEHTEEEVALAVVPRPGTALTEEALLSHCRARMAPSMVPLYVRFLDRLPKTPTEKVAKEELRAWHRKQRATDETTS